MQDKQVIFPSADIVHENEFRKQIFHVSKTIITMNINMKVFAVLSAVMLICIGCKNKNSADNAAEIHNDNSTIVSQENDVYNPAKRFRAYKPLRITDSGFVYGIKIYDANGAVKYSDEDAEKYYDHYAIHFLYAYLIAENGKEVSEYLDKHLFDVVCNLPLDNSYPSNVRDVVNKIYYEYKDRAQKIHLYNRDIGCVNYAYDSSNANGKRFVDCISVHSDDYDGALMIAGSSYEY